MSRNLVDDDMTAVQFDKQYQFSFKGLDSTKPLDIDPQRFATHTNTNVNSPKESTIALKRPFSSVLPPKRKKLSVLKSP